MRNIPLEYSISSTLICGGSVKSWIEELVLESGFFLNISSSARAKDKCSGQHCVKVRGSTATLSLLHWWGQGRGRVLGNTVVLHMWWYDMLIKGQDLHFGWPKPHGAPPKRSYSYEGACVLLYGEGQKREKAKIIPPKWFLSCKKNLDIIFLKFYANTQDKYCVQTFLAVSAGKIKSSS